MSTGDGNGYALDASSPVRHVATAMAGAAPAALSIDEMAATYNHIIPADLYRVRYHNNLATDEEAIRWLIEHAIGLLGKQVESDGNGGYRLVVPVEKLRSQRRKVVLNGPDPHERLRDPFNPMSGRWSENIRSRRMSDLDELRESMRAFGWIEHLPAIADERGVVIVGHRRLAVAAELGIDSTDHIRRITFGDGDEGDARRSKLAIASNLGARPLTPGDRQGIAEYLYGERDWTMARIAEALNVSVMQVSRDLTPVKKTEQRGRPRILTPEQVQTVIDEFHEFGGDKSIPQLREQLGQRSDAAIIKVVDQERGRRDVREGRTCVCPRCEFHHPPNGASA